MKFQVDSLKRNYFSKDQYSRFLATNFKQSHGMDMINNYKKNNQSDIEFIERFSLKNGTRRWSVSIETYNQRTTGLASMD